MKSKKDHVLSNGYTFLAVTTGHYGAWAKATDPLTAIRNAADNNGYGSEGKVAVQCWFGLNDKMQCGSMGGIQYQHIAPTPIGMFLVSKSSIKPMPKGAFNEKHQDHNEWMLDVMTDIQEFDDKWKNQIIETVEEIMA